MKERMKKIIAVALPVAFIAALALVFSCSARNPDPQNVRHIILWTLNADLSSEQKLELMESAAADVRELEKIIPGVISMDVYYEGRLESSNCDFMFDFRFESEDALKAFSENPAHLAVAAKLKPYISGRTCFDMKNLHRF